MRLIVGVNGSVADVLRGQVDRAKIGVRAGIDRTGKEAQALLRTQTRAGFGPRSTRLSNAWRQKTYPAQPSLGAAGLVYTQAPLIVDAFDKGVPIRPSRGRKYLAVPTAINRQIVGRGTRPIITPQQMVATGKAFVFRSRRSGVRLWMLPASEATKIAGMGSPAGSARMERRRQARIGRFARAVAAGGTRGARSVEFRDRGIVPLFILIPSVTPSKRFNVNSARDLISRRVAPAIVEAWRSAR